MEEGRPIPDCAWGPPPLLLPQTTRIVFLTPPPLIRQSTLGREGAREQTSLPSPRLCHDRLCAWHAHYVCVCATCVCIFDDFIGEFRHRAEICPPLCLAFLHPRSTEWVGPSIPPEKMNVLEPSIVIEHCWHCMPRFLHYRRCCP